MAPSLTEMVFDLGAEEMLVGVTAQCAYPAGAADIPKIGEYQTPSVEAVLGRKPTLILALEEHAPLFPLLDQTGLRYAVFDHRSFDGVLDSLTRLGEICRRVETARTLRQRLADAFTPDPAAGEGPKTLFIIGRDYGKGVIANAYVVGRDNLYDRLLAAIGCRNAYEGSAAYPVFSGEGVSVLQPELIIEALYMEPTGTDVTVDHIRDDWNSLSFIPAVKNDRIITLSAPYVFIPGVRLLQVKDELEALVRQAVPQAATP